MNTLLSLLIALNLNFNISFNNQVIELTYPRLIDAFILAYDAMYNGDIEPKKDFIILDMESIYFTDTTYEERQKAIEHFKKYNKEVLNASLFKLKEIGLANKKGTIIINGDLLMITNISSNGPGNLIIEGMKYHSATVAYLYRITLKSYEGSYMIEKVEQLGSA